MYTNDDRHTAKVGDRLIAAAIAGFLGYWLGGFIGLVTMKVTGDPHGVAWVLAVGCGVFGFIAPSRSREIWSRFWEELLGFLSSKK